MNAVSSLRFPTAFVVALLIIGGLFSVLNAMTSVVIDVTPIPAREINFIRQKTDTPIPDRRAPVKPVRDEILIPETPTLGKGEREITEVVIMKVDPAVVPKIERASFGRDTEAVPLVRVPPEYPQRAASQGLEGWVKVRFTINEIGAVEDAVVVDSSASVFESAALNAITRWRYNPQVIDGTAVERRGVDVMLRFNLAE